MSMPVDQHDRDFYVTEWPQLELASAYRALEAKDQAKVHKLRKHNLVSVDLLLPLEDANKQRAEFAHQSILRLDEALKYATTKLAKRCVLAAAGAARMDVKPCAVAGVCCFDFKTVVNEITTMYTPHNMESSTHYISAGRMRAWVQSIMVVCNAQWWLDSCVRDVLQSCVFIDASQFQTMRQHELLASRRRMFTFACVVLRDYIQDLNHPVVETVIDDSTKTTAEAEEPLPVTKLLERQRQPNLSHSTAVVPSCA